MMEAVGGSVEILDDINDVPQAVADYLRDNNLPAHVRRGADPLLAKLPWHRGGTLEVAEGRAGGYRPRPVTRAFAGVAETGTIIQVSGAGQPDDAQLPARSPHRGARGRDHLRQL